MESLFLWIERY